MAIAVVLKAAQAVAWFDDASPKEQMTTLSSGTGASSPTRFCLPIMKAAPTAFGRWLAMVEVWGGIHRSTEPKDLVASPSDGFVCGGNESEEYIEYRALSADLVGPLDEETPGTVVEERGVRVSARRRNDGVRLVP